MNGKSLVGGITPLYQRIIALFPKDISLCFAYGSAVYPQKQYNGVILKNNVIDLIFVVPNAFIWHEENKKHNPKHYSGLRYFGHKTITRIQETYGAGVYYNTLIPFEDVTFKYGVVSQTSLISDLLDWNYLYISGRLHKPVLMLKDASDNMNLRNALKLNIRSAMHAALLQLPQSFTEEDLYKTIANLSYKGDFRMTFGEDKNKVNSIVGGQKELFRELYAPVIKSLKNYVELESVDGEIIGRQDSCPGAKLYHLYQLPRTPQRNIVRQWNTKSKKKHDAEDVLAAVAYDIDTDVIVDKALSDIVWSSSVTQSLKGIFTAGLMKSFRYSLAKVKKMLKSKPKSLKAS